MMLFKLFKKEPAGEEVVLKIKGMHCPSCSINIDDSLEELTGVFESNTSYAKGITRVRIDPNEVTREKLIGNIKSLGYTVV